MATDPGGFLNLSPCFWFCCIRKRTRVASGESSKSREFDYSESSEDNEEEYEYPTLAVKSTKEALISDTPHPETQEAIKIADEKAGYGAITQTTDEVDGSVRIPSPNWNDIADDYLIASPDAESSEEEGTEAISKPLESMSIVSDKMLFDEDDTRSNVSDQSLREIHVLGDPDMYSLSNVSASREQLYSKVGDTSSVDSWSMVGKREDPETLAADRTSQRSQDNLSIKSWSHRTSKSPSAKGITAETASVKSWTRDETASIDMQSMKRSVSNTDSMAVSLASLDETAEPDTESSLVLEAPAQEIVPEPVVSAAEALIQEASTPPTVVQKSEAVVEYSPPDISAPELPPPVNTPPAKPPKTKRLPSPVAKPATPPVVPEIIVAESPTLKPKESVKSNASIDSGVVMDKSTTYSNLKSKSAVLPDQADAVSIASATSMTSLDMEGKPQKKKKLKIFKKLKFKKKKKNKLQEAQEQGTSVSTPNINLDDDSYSSMSNNSKSRYSASLLLASLDDLSDEDILVQESEAVVEYSPPDISAPELPPPVNTPPAKPPSPVAKPATPPVVPEIIVAELSTPKPKESVKSNASIDSGVVMDKSTTYSNLKSKSAVSPDQADAVSIASATSITSLDTEGKPKKKKKLKIFKKLEFKKKKKNKLQEAQEQETSVSTPNINLDIDSYSSMSNNSKS